MLRKQVKEILDRQDQAQANEPEPVREFEFPNQSSVPEAEGTTVFDRIQIDTEGIPDVQEHQPDMQESVIDTEMIDNRGMFKKPFSFSGRIRRLEYGISFVIYFVWYFILEIAGKTPNLSQGVAIILLMSIVPMLWFLWAQSCKRCHDRGNSGWYQLIPFYFVILLFGDGDFGDNQYGNNPKE